MLPSTFNGVTLQKFSMKGAQFLGQDPTSDFNKAVTALGLTTADVSVAVAADPTGKMDVTFAAIRFAGADGSKLLQVFTAAAQASGSLVTSANVGGKDVIKTKDSSGTEASATSTCATTRSWASRPRTTRPPRRPSSSSPDAIRRGAGRRGLPSRPAS